MLEIVWSRMLGWLLGATTWSVMTVLVVFMGGLGLGAVVWGRRSSRTSRPLRLFAWLEIAIGLYTLAVPLILDGLGRVFVVATHWLGDSAGTAIPLRVATAVLALALPTLLMGGTLPVLTRFAASRRGQPGRIAGLLYAVNTAGAVLGCALTGCVLIFWLGVVETNTLAALVDLAVGIAALAADGRVGVTVDAAPPSVRVQSRSSVGQAALLVASASGFFGLAYEMLWTRSLLATVTDDTTYAFTLMLTAFLAGHALGAALGGRAADRLGPGRTWQQLGTAQVLAAATALLAIPFLVVIRDPISRASFAEGMHFWSGKIPFHLVLSLAVFAPSACFLGASFSLAARLYVGQGRPVGASTGRLYGLNTLGAILGAASATAWLIPTFGTQQTVVGLAIVQAVVGALAIVLGGGSAAGWQRPTDVQDASANSTSIDAKPLGPERLSSRVLGVTAWAAVITAGYGLNWLCPLRSVYAKQEPGRLIALLEGAGAAITVHERISGDRVISINGVNVAGTNPVLRTTQKLQAHLPVCLHPAPRRVLQIGFGSGGTCYSVSRHTEVQRIEIAELNPDVLKVASEWFSDINQHVLDDPRVRVRIVDAKSYVAATDQTYDLILSDSTHPRFRGNAALYGRDYFVNCSRRLRPGGMMSTWLPLYGMSVDDIRSILKSFQSVFPHVQVWYPNSEPHENTIVIAALTPIAIDPEALARRLADVWVAADLSEVGITSTAQVLDYFLLGDRGVAAFASSGRLNTDDHPRLEYLAPTTGRRKQSFLDNFAALCAVREPIEPYLVSTTADQRATLGRWYRATTYKLAGQLYELQGSADKALAAYAEGIRINPEDGVARNRLNRFHHLFGPPIDAVPVRLPEP
jgi:spermidine synthase